jgi:putative transposase
MAEAIFYLVRSGCAWRMLPRHFPPWPMVHSQLTRWRKDGTLRRMHDRLREHAREKGGRHREPSAAVINSQTARTTGGGGPDRGFDAAKRTFGRKRHILVDASGLILLAHIHTASLHDTAGARQMIEAVPITALPRLELVWADGAYTGPFAKWLEKARNWRMEVPFHRQCQAWRYGLEERPAGFQVLPRRWVVERTFAWLSRSRRLARDYERLPETGVAMIYTAMSRIMLRRIA